MSAPIVIPPLQPGICDAGVSYSVVLIARNAAVMDCTPPDGILIPPAGRAGATIGGTRVEKWQIQCTDVFTDSDRLYEIPCTALTAIGGESTAFVQPMVFRKYAAVWRALTYTHVAANAADPSGDRTFSLAAHGLAVGDRIALSAPGFTIPGGGVDSVHDEISNLPRLVTAVPDANRFTVGPLSGTGGGVDFRNWPTVSDGTFSYVYTLTAEQHGRQQGDITGAAHAEGARGAAFSYAITTTDTGSVRAQGAPAGLGIDTLGQVLAGTPVEWGVFPAILRAGTMARYLAITVAAGTYDALISTSAEATAIAGRVWSQPFSAPLLAAPVWSLSGNPQAVEITLASGNSGRVQGIFSVPGLYTLELTATSGADVVTKTIAVTVPAVPVIEDAFYYDQTAYANRVFVWPEDQFFNVQFAASASPTSWSISAVPPGLSFDTATGTLSGNVLRSGFFRFVLVASNSHGDSLPVTFGLNATRVENAVNRAPYRPWFHADPTLVDIVMDLRTGLVRSFYMLAGNVLALNMRDDLRLGVIIEDNGAPLAAAQVAELRLAVRPADDFEAGDLLSLRSVTPVDTEGGTWFELEGQVKGSELDARWGALNAAPGPNPGSREIAAMAQILVETAAGVTRRSNLFNIVFRQDAIT